MAISARNICSIGIAILITALRNDFREYNLPIPYPNTVITSFGFLLIGLAVFVHFQLSREQKARAAAAAAATKAKQPKSQ